MDSDKAPASGDTKSAATKELANKELANKELANKELANKELANKELANKELANKELANNEPAPKEPAAKEPVVKGAITKEPTAKHPAVTPAANGPTANKPTADKATTNGPGASLPGANLPGAVAKSPAASSAPQTASASAKAVAPPAAREKTTFAEAAMKLGGKSDDEARRMGAVDRADDEVEAMFAARYQTTNSPVHRAIWDAQVDPKLFVGEKHEPTLDVHKVIINSLDAVRRHREAGTLLNEHRKISDTVLADLATAGYWGLLVEKKYGGAGAPFATFAKFLTQMAMQDPTIAGLASVHGCIGAVDPVATFGNDEQKQRWLPKLASGERLSAFALTEPCAGSDLTALRTTARLEGNQYVVNGEKLFITNVVPGRTIGLVCLIQDRPAVLVVDLPAEENDSFRLKKYGLYALRHTWNQGIIFQNFRVPAENLLRPTAGDGLTVAYHGLNRGRVALCANAAGTMRLMMASIVPWARFRKTYGETISTRELVRRRLGMLAGMIVGCDALVDWCGHLLDAGYRGEMECVIAKIFGSEAQKTAAIEMFMKTHGGRSFLHGHMLGDNVHEFLAPCIYEGEGEMLGMAFFKSLVKQHGVDYFQPIGEAAQAAGLKKPNPANPLHAWKLRGPLWSYGKWFVGQRLTPKPSIEFPFKLPSRLQRHAEWAASWLQRSPREISGAMRKHQLKLADRQCRISEISQRVQDAVVMLCASLYAGRREDEILHAAADVLCQDLRRRLTGERPSDRYFREVTRLGEAITAGQSQLITDAPVDEILMKY